MHPDTTFRNNRAWVTLVTKVSYIPGCLVLDHGLRSVKSKYPLVVMILEDFPSEAREILSLQGIQTVEVGKLMAKKSKGNIQEARFLESWTKLRAFDMINYEQIVLLDSDMVVRKNMDELLEMPLEHNWIAAVHACACNPRKLVHYPRDWVPDNCAYTNKCQPAAIRRDSPRPYNLLNGGLVVIRPSKDQFEALKRFLDESPLVETFQFPDQDLMAEFYKGRWKPLSYIYNALKTLRVIHQELWKDDDVKCIHYILYDKPWMTYPQKQTSEDANSLQYKVVNQWWWDAYAGVLEEVKRGGSSKHADALKYLKPLVAGGS